MRNIFEPFPYIIQDAESWFSKPIYFHTALPSSWVVTPPPYMYLSPQVFQAFNQGAPSLWNSLPLPSLFPLFSFYNRIAVHKSKRIDHFLLCDSIIACTEFHRSVCISMSSLTKTVANIATVFQLRMSAVILLPHPTPICWIFLEKSHRRA